MTQTATPMASAPDVGMIQVHDLAFAYPKANFRLEVPRLALAAGEKVAIVGPSGTGKTTLLNLLAGLLVPQHGSIIIDGSPMTGIGDTARRRLRRHKLGFVFQDFQLIPYLSAYDNILHPYRLDPEARLTPDVRARARALAAAVGVSERLGQRPRALSQGEKQRVAICRALIRRPRLLLADEATGNLDPENKTLILDLLFRRAEEDGAALLAVTHDHGLLDRFDRVIDFSTFRYSLNAAAEAAHV